MVMTEFKVLNLFEREDFALKVVSLLRLMGFNGETGIDCGTCTCNYSSTGRDIV